MHTSKHCNICSNTFTWPPHLRMIYQNLLIHYSIIMYHEWKITWGLLCLWQSQNYTIVTLIRFNIILGKDLQMNKIHYQKGIECTTWKSLKKMKIDHSWLICDMQLPYTKQRTICASSLHLTTFRTQQKLCHKWAIFVLVCIQQMLNIFVYFA